MRNLLIAFLISTITFCFSLPAIANQAIEQKVIKLQDKVSKKISKTFCNSTGFGISSEGALKFALGETKSEFSKNPLIEKVDLNGLKDQILVDIGDTCYSFELSKSDLDPLNLAYQPK